MNLNRRVGGGKGTVPIFFMFGFVFSGVGFGMTAFILYMSVTTGDPPWFVAFFTGIFAVIGVVFIALAIRSIVRNAAENKVSKMGIATTGTFVDSELSHTTNNVGVFRVIFSYTTDTGEIAMMKTRGMFRLTEVTALREMGQFPVKYKGAVAVIVATMAEVLKAQQQAVLSENEMFSNMGNMGAFGTGFNQAPLQPQATNCAGCGSPRTSGNERFCAHCGRAF